MDTKEILDLFTQVIADADSSECKLEIKIGDMRKNIRAIYYDTMSQVEKAIESPETEVLVVPFLQGAMRYIPLLYHFSLEEYLDGKLQEKLDRYEALKKFLFESPVLVQWSETFQEVFKVIEKTGMHTNEELLKDPPRVAGILLDAFMFPKLYGTKRIKVAAGADSGMAPVLVKAMPRYATLGEFYDYICEIGIESCIMFAMIAPTYSQATDTVDAWAKKGTEPAYNTLGNKKDFDPETEIQLQESYVAIGVKRGGNIWLNLHKSDVARNNSFYEYGKRKSYLPFQVLFNKAPAADTDCTALAFPGNAWRLDSIADEEQALWFPAFLWLLEREYYKGKVDPEEPVVAIRESVKLQSGSPQSSHLPAVRTKLSVSVDVMHVPPGIKTSAECEQLLSYLGLSEKDILDIAIAPTISYGSPEEFEKNLWHRCRYALSIIAAKKMHDDWENNHKKLDAWYRQKCEENQAFILEQLGIHGSRIDQISSHIVDGRKAYHEDGSPVMDRGTQSVERTSIDDARSHSYYPKILFCLPTSLYGKRPPVAIRVGATEPEDLSLLAGIPSNELPWQYQIWGKCAGGVPYNYSRCPNDIDPILLIGNLYSGTKTVHIAISKTEYKRQIQIKNYGRAI